MDLYELSFDIELKDEIYLFLEEKVPFGWEEEDKGSVTGIKLYFSSLRDAEKFKRELILNFPVKVNIIKRDSSLWEKSWKEHFKPINVSGEFLVVPPWEWKKYKDSNLKKIIIYPQMAFGTGHHPTTYLCLESISYLVKTNKISKGSLFLDVGTGSGILSFGCRMLGLKGIGLDIDKNALKNAKLNKKLNRVKENLLFVLGDLSSLKGKFKLILVNIQANFHLIYGKRLIELLDTNGWLVLSGMVLEQKEKIINFYNSFDVKGPIMLFKDGWINLLWQKYGKR